MWTGVCRLCATRLEVLQFVRRVVGGRNRGNSAWARPIARQFHLVPPLGTQEASKRGVWLETQHADSVTGTANEDDATLESSDNRTSGAPDSRTLSSHSMHRRQEDGWQDDTPLVRAVEGVRDPTSAQLTAADLSLVFKKFYQRSGIWETAKQFGFQGAVMQKAMSSFRRVVTSPRQVQRSPELSATLASILTGGGHVDDLFPSFLLHVRRKFPDKAIAPELKRISDLSSPHTWFPLARQVGRRLVYHAGPTNSGKTHHALQEFFSAKRAVYCAPLRMLAHEIFQRANKEGVPCDLLTGDDYQLANGSGGAPANHLACTVEMASTTKLELYDVAVIDEVQMVQDEERGGAWTKAILGIPAREVHLCGHECALDLVQRLAKNTGEELQVCRYDRLVPLVVQNKSLRGLYRNIRPGDCVVCFSRRKIFEVRQSIEAATQQSCAIIYGGLPPAIRVQQADLFNRRSPQCNILVATDAIGMGVNLNIRRIVFHDLLKFNGRDMSTITSSHVKQIAGRAGRFGKDHDVGEVTTFCSSDLDLLHQLLEVKEDDIPQAGISPSYEQIKLFSHHLPKASLSEILAQFVKVATLDGNYFLCDIEAKMEKARLLQGVSLPLSDLFTLTNAPVNTKSILLSYVLQKFASVCSKGQELTLSQLCKILFWPQPSPNNLRKLAYFEELHDAIDLYLWCSMRFPAIFVAPEDARQLQEKIRSMITHSIATHHRGKHRRGVGGQSKAAQQRREKMK